MSGTRNWTTWGYRLLLAACVLLGAMALTPQHAAAQGLGAGIAQQTLSQIPGATAQTASTSDGGGTVQKILDAFSNATSKWKGPLRQFATSLFWLLVSIEIAWTAISLAIKGAELGEWLQTMVNQIFFIGFFAALLFWSDVWAQAIINSFQQAANQTADAAIKGLGNNANVGTQASTAVNNLDPASVAATGVAVATAIWQKGMTYFIESLFTGLAAVGVLISLMMVAAQILIVKVESFIVVGASVLMMGFGGSRWTKDYAMKTLNYAVAVGAKLFTLQLIVVLGLSVINQLITGATEGSTGLGLGGTVKLGTFREDLNFLDFVVLLLGVVIVFYLLAQAVPDLIQGLLSGVLIDTAASRIVQQSLPTPWGVAKGTAVASLGMGMAVHQVGGLAAARTEAAALGEPGHSKSFLRNFASSAVRVGFENLIHRLSGAGEHRFNPAEGTVLGQVSHAARRRRDAQRGQNAELKKQQKIKADKAATANMVAGAAPNTTAGASTPNTGGTPKPGGGKTGA